MREKIDRAIKKYLEGLKRDKVDSPHIFSENFALSRIDKNTLGQFSDDEKYKLEFIRLFKKEFSAKKPYMQLAKREGRDLDFYLHKQPREISPM
tara:strand:- start:1600 stop:1881 length:282 start_codon:yes stop_codon:yes gene_type:complete